MEEQRWTLDELAERVDVALAVDYAGPPSARVRAVPDRRAIRWYTTIGLIDRPVAHRGRTALYGPRHLLQLVAVKRLQASGLPLVAIQQELAGATDTQLARVARLPGGPAALDGGGSPLVRDSAPSRARPPTACFEAPLPNGPWPVRLGRSPVARGGPGSGGSRRPPSPPPPAPRPARRTPICRSRPCGGCGWARGRPCCWNRGGRWMRRTLQAVLDAARPLLAVLRERGLDRPGRNLGPGPGHRPAGEDEARREHP